MDEIVEGERTEARADSTPAITTETTRPPWWRRNILALILGAVVLALAITLVVVLLPGGGSYKVTVKFQLQDSDTRAAGCHGQGGYDDIDAGAPVTLTNDKGDILAAGSLPLGRPAFPDDSACAWTVTFTDVPAGEKFYSVEVSHRGAITKSDAELRAAGYEFDLTLG